MLKPNKHDEDSGLSTNNFKHTCNELFVHIIWFWSTVLTHGSAPEYFLIETTIPILKVEVWMQRMHRYIMA